MSPNCQNIECHSDSPDTDISRGGRSDTVLDLGFTIKKYTYWTSKLDLYNVNNYKYKDVTCYHHYNYDISSKVM